MELKYEEMTPEQRAEFRARFEEEDKARKQQEQEDREAYKDMVDKFVNTKIEMLQGLSKQMMEIKQEVFESAELLIDMKDDLFKTKADRRSNTFTTKDGRKSITLGNRVNEGWDDTVNNGIAKVKDYLASLAKDDDTAALVETVMGLLAKDRKGNLKASKVLELEKLAQKKQDEMFLDGIAIIRAAYRPEPSCQFIEVTLKDEKGNEQKLPLSLAAMK